MPSLRNNQLLFEEVTRKVDDLMKNCYFVKTDLELDDTILKYFDYQTAIGFQSETRPPTEAFACKAPRPPNVDSIHVVSTSMEI